MGRGQQLLHGRRVPLRDREPGGGAPPSGDRELTNLLTKQSYPLGLIVNTRGERFVDEGADYRNYTYAKYGAAILRQPGARAFQLFDAQTEPLLRQDEYTAPGVSRFEAGTIRELARKLGIDPEGLERTVACYNAAIQPGRFDPSVKDGKRTMGLVPPKSNWALPLQRPPFLGFAVTCGNHVHVRRRARGRRSPRARPARPPHPRADGRRRAGRRALLPQLPRRQRPQRGRGLRPPRRYLGGPLLLAQARIHIIENLGLDELRHPTRRGTT